MENLKQRLENMIIGKQENKYCEINIEENEIGYFAGFYVIWKDKKIIHTNYFIFHKNEADDVYKADRKLWEKHLRSFKEHPFSELNEAIGDILNKDIEIEIVDSCSFEDIYSYEDIKFLMKEQYFYFRKNYELVAENGESLHKKEKDPYNMSELIKEIDKIIYQSTPIWYPFF